MWLTSNAANRWENDLDHVHQNMKIKIYKVHVYTFQALVEAIEEYWFYFLKIVFPYLAKHNLTIEQFKHHKAFRVVSNNVKN